MAVIKNPMIKDGIVCCYMYNGNKGVLPLESCFQRLPFLKCWLRGIEADEI